jgi:hypothetical protein
MVTLLLLQLTLAFPPGALLSPLTVATAVAEADSLWSSYGVSIAALDDCSAPVFSPVIRVAIADSMPARGAGSSRASEREPNQKRALGAIVFGSDGEPSPAISIFLADILRLVAGARLFGAPESQWPPILRELIIGRVIGRVLAHEIGHYLLRMPGHTRSGLMRPNYLTMMLVAPERRGFALSKPEAARVTRPAQARVEAARW